MNVRARYNEIDPEAVAVLRELVECGVIAPGDVDARSIKDVTADDVRGYAQCHWFAGAGLWSVAARIAGWPDSRSIWTASCPCQPFSGAGRQGGADDARHLWPDLYRIIRAARDAGQPIPILVGEQVAGSLGYDWFDGVRADLAREKIAARTIDIPACAVDAPHERNRLWWCAVADTQEQRNGDVVNAPRERWGQGCAEPEILGRRTAFASTDLRQRNGSWWADAEWLSCHDGKARRAKPGIPMLVDGMAGRASVWRLAGNSIVPILAAEVLASILEAEAIMSTRSDEMARVG